MKIGFRSLRGSKSLVVGMLALSIAFFAQTASAGVSVTLSGPGAGIGDTIITGHPVTFNIHVNNDAGVNIWGLSHGFRLYSPEGATWSPPAFDTAGGLNQYFDILVGARGYSADGLAEDTIGVIAAAHNYTGIPLDWDDVVLTITTTLDSSQAGKTIAIDSCFWGPGGRWVWISPSLEDIFPSWDGPHSYTISNTPCMATGDIDNNGVELTVADLVYLLRFLLGEGPAPVNMYEADLNGDCLVDTADFNLYMGVIEFGIGFLPRYPIPTCCHPSVTMLTDEWAMMSVALSGPGAGTGDTILCGEPVTFDIRMTNNTGRVLKEASNGFRLYSPEGATWVTPVYDTAGGIGNYFDQGVSLHGFSVNGSGEDTIGISGSAMLNGVPGVYDNVILKITTMFDAAQAGKTISIDSTWFKPTGRWIWDSENFFSVIPRWNGPRNYALKLTYVPGDADGNGIVNISDVVFLMNYIFGGGTAPVPLAAGDADCNHMTNITDCVYLITHIFSGGPAPCGGDIK